MSFRATVPALYLWGFIRLPCIRASWIFLFCSSVQSSTRWPNSVLSLGTRDVEGWQLPIDRRVSQDLSFGAPYEPSVVLAACPHLQSSFVCWDRHRHHHRYDLASCLRNRLHHLYLGRRPPVHRSRHQYQHRRQLLASFEACPRRSLLHHPRSSWLLWPRLPAQCLSSSEVSSSPEILGIGTCCPCFFWKLVTNSLIWSVLQPRLAKAFCRARVSP